MNVSEWSTLVSGNAPSPLMRRGVVLLFESSFAAWEAPKMRPEGRQARRP